MVDIIRFYGEGIERSGEFGFGIKWEGGNGGSGEGRSGVVDINRLDGWGWCRIERGTW